eukprot:scaffold38515_cov191-Amphora_coffeaeformis.AAC.2
MKRSRNEDAWIHDQESEQNELSSWNAYWYGTYSRIKTTGWSSPQSSSVEGDDNVDDSHKI